jgi:hypothetical protein
MTDDHRRACRRDPSTCRRSTKTKSIASWLRNRPSRASQIALISGDVSSDTTAEGDADTESIYRHCLRLTNTRTGTTRYCRSRTSSRHRTASGTGRAAGDSPTQCRHCRLRSILMRRRSRRTHGEWRVSPPAIPGSSVTRSSLRILRKLATVTSIAALLQHVTFVRLTAMCLRSRIQVEHESRLQLPEPADGGATREDDMDIRAKGCGSQVMADALSRDEIWPSRAAGPEHRSPAAHGEMS